jgi:hypothetical protein
MVFGEFASPAESVVTSTETAGIPRQVVASELRPPAGARLYEQRDYGRQALPPLISTERAETVLNRFRIAYTNLGSPRVVVTVNPGFAETEAVVPVASSSQPQPLNLAPGKLADSQTRREVERLLGRPMRLAGVRLMDLEAGEEAIQRSAARTRADARNALAGIADIAIEVLISAKSGYIPSANGSVEVGIPDLQVTAVRLRDSRILGQASSSDILGQGMNAAKLTRAYGVPVLVEATGLALLEDLSLGVH